MSRKPSERELRDAHENREVSRQVQTYVSRLADAELRRKAAADGCSVAQYVRTLIYKDLFPPKE